MTSGDPDFLYQLLPEYLRFRDVAEGEPLRALFRVLEGEFQRLSNNMDALYDDWFIETCADWVVPYIAELVGVRGVDRPNGYRRSERSLVGNALRKRRRKGVPATLGEAASEATGWPVLAVPAIPLLATTQSMAHPEPKRRTTVSLRDAPALALLGTPFDILAHTASVTTGRERWNLPGVGLFRWRLESYPVERATVAPVPKVAAGCYTFHPFGIDSPLFNRPGTGEAPSPLPSPAAFPGPLTRRQLQGETASRWAGRAEPFAIFVLLAGQPEPVAVGPSEIVAADLSSWRRPALLPATPATPAAPASSTPSGSAAGQPPLRVAVDPERGRLALLSGIDPAEVAEVRASYCYAFSADLGGGPYARPERNFEWLTPGAGLWEAEVATAFENAASSASTPQGTTPARFGTLDAALESWPPSMDGSIRILDNSTYEVTTEIELATRDAPPQPRRLSIAAAQGARPCLRGNLVVSGPARQPPQPAGAPAGQKVHGAAELDLSGLWIDGQVVLAGEVNVLRIVHTTLRPPVTSRTASGTASGAAGGAAAAPPPASVRLAATEPGAKNLPSALEVQIAQSIVGPLELPAALLGLEIVDSIVDAGAAGGGAAIYGCGTERLGPTALLARATIFGEVRLRQLVVAQDVLFTAPLFVERNHQGEVRFSYLPEGSRTPRRVHCLSETDGSVPLRPIFTATAYGAPGYAQLDRLTPQALRTGSERGSEIGVFENLDQPARDVLLDGAVADFLRWGMFTEIVDVT